MPLSDRDYMRRPSPLSRRIRTPGGAGWLTKNPVLVLIVVNLVMYLLTSLRPGLQETLGLVPALFPERFWTIVTCLFLHAGFGHLFFNMLALLIFGNTLTRLVNPGRLWLVYFLGGIIGNALFLLLHRSAPVLLMGASGAVYAVVGALVVMVPNMRIAFWGIIPMPLWIYVIVFMVLLAIPPFVDIGIAWQAHIGGLATGLVAGVIFRRRGGYYRY